MDKRTVGVVEESCEEGGWRVSESEEGRGVRVGFKAEGEERRGVRGRDWRKRRVCVRVWLEKEKGC